MSRAILNDSHTIAALKIIVTQVIARIRAKSAAYRASRDESL